MNEMIEKVARALCVANCDNPDEADFGFLSDSVKGYAWQGYIPQARAAIEAMREPSEMMVDAAHAAGAHPADDLYYGAMIDAALKD